MMGKKSPPNTTIVRSTPRFRPGLPRLNSILLIKPSAAGRRRREPTSPTAVHSTRFLPVGN